MSFGSVLRVAVRAGWCGAWRIECYGGGDHVVGGREVRVYPDIYGLREE